jgi:hypothetical protein
LTQKVFLPFLLSIGNEMTEHNVLSGDQLHDAKGIENALAEQVYKATGLGSGVWESINTANEVIVNSMDDFPVPIAGVRTLLAGTRYVIGTSLTTNDSFVLGQGTSITAFNINSPIFTYTGTGTFFSGVDVTVMIQDIKLDCPNGQVFDFKDVAVPNANIFLSKDIFINTAAKMGTFDSMVSLVITDVSCFNATQGYTILGSGWRVWRFQDFGMISGNAAFVGLDLTAASCTGILITTALFSMFAGGTAIRGAANSGNVTANNIARIANMSLPAGGTPLDGISPDDSRWFFSQNDQVPDTNPEAFAWVRNNVTATIITTANVPELVTAVFTEGSSSQFTVSAQGRITYTGERSITLPISASITASTDAGVDRNITFYLGKNGVFNPSTGQKNSVRVGKPANTVLLWQEVWNTGDYCEIFAENNLGNENIIAADIKFVVN